MENSKEKIQGIENETKEDEPKIERLYINFRERTVEERKKKYDKLTSKNPGKIPVVFEKHKNSKIMINNSENPKFISSRNTSLKKVTKNLRNYWKLDKDCSLFFSCDNQKILRSDILIGNLYDQYKEKDGFLYI